MLSVEMAIIDSFGGFCAVMREPREVATRPHAFDAVTVGEKLKHPYCRECGGGLLHEVHSTDRLIAGGGNV